MSPCSVINALIGFNQLMGGSAGPGFNSQKNFAVKNGLVFFWDKYYHVTSYLQWMKPVMGRSTNNLIKEL